MSSMTITIDEVTFTLDEREARAFLTGAQVGLDGFEDAQGVAQDVLGFTETDADMAHAQAGRMLAFFPVGDE